MSATPAPWELRRNGKLVQTFASEAAATYALQNSVTGWGWTVQAAAPACRVKGAIPLYADALLAATTAEQARREAATPAHTAIQFKVGEALHQSWSVGFERMEPDEPEPCDDNARHSAKVASLLAERDALSAQLAAVTAQRDRLADAVRLALEVIRRHDAGLCGSATHREKVSLPLDSYCGEDGLTDPDGVQGIGDVLRAALADMEGPAK